MHGPLKEIVSSSVKDFQRRVLARMDQIYYEELQKANPEPSSEAPEIHSFKLTRKYIIVHCSNRKACKYNVWFSY